MSDYLVTDTELTSVANAIRTKGGTSANLSFPTGFVSAINAISGGLEYEEGQFTLTANKTIHTIVFEKDHGIVPSVLIIADETQTASSATNTCRTFAFIDYNRLFGAPVLGGNSSQYFIMQHFGAQKASAGGIIGDVYSYSTDENGRNGKNFTFYHGTYPLQANRTYKWIAIWK